MNNINSSVILNANWMNPIDLGILEKIAQAGVDVSSFYQVRDLCFKKNAQLKKAYEEYSKLEKK